jgi:hypothetical protein
MPSEATVDDAALQNYAEHAVQTFTSAAKSMRFIHPQAETPSSSSNVSVHLPPPPLLCSEYFH